MGWKNLWDDGSNFLAAQNQQKLFSGLPSDRGPHDHRVSYKKPYTDWADQLTEMSADAEDDGNMVLADQLLDLRNEILNYHDIVL